MDGFPFVHRERARWSDCDPLGHVNNAAYSTFLEQARVALLGDLGGFILARVEIDFRAETQPGEDVEIGSRCSRVGTKSFELEHELRVDGRLVAQAKSVLVGYDYAQGQSVPVPAELKERLNA
ncbi:MAG: acyl-CoA thioesterase [Gaiellaceae bacterium]